MSTSDVASELVDWDLAAKTAQRLAGSGPQVTAAQAQEAVADLHRFAAESESHVREVTGLDGSSGAAPVVVVDRGGWVTANTASLRTIVAPLASKVHEARAGRSGWPLDYVGPKATGVETGVFLAFVAGRVLGQFDPFFQRPGTDHRHGRLLLVAPNVVHVEQELDVVPRDFRLWVCLHEETHRVQFTAVPWLRAHLEGEIQEFVSATQVDSSMLTANLRDLVQALVRVVKGEKDAVSLLDALQTPEQKAVIERVTALMSLLEGHADVVMDRVGPQVVPTVEVIRRRFQRRRRGSSGVDRVMRRVLGLETKMRQYRDGAAFVHEVVERAGMEGFNRVWESAETLPTRAEIVDPAAWVRRVL